MAELRRAQQRRTQRRRLLVVAIVVVAALAAAYLLTLNHHHKKATHVAAKSTTTTSPGTTSTTTGSTTTTTVPKLSVATITAPKGVGCPNLNGSSPHYTKFVSTPPMCINVNDSYTATMKTDAGTFTIKLFPKLAPKTVNSFVFLAGYHFYDGIYFQRVIPGFVDQGGDPTGTGAGGPGYTLPDEYPSSTSVWTAGAVAMANTGQPNTGGSQFFIVVSNETKGLSTKYSYFGRVTSGMKVVDAINQDGSSSGTPKKYHKILSVTITQRP